jgi:hypothetical protein
MTAPYYGKREPGSLTAASPGDTLYFHFGTYNDSGNSETDTGFSVTDIEVYKNNGTSPRLTDSGYALILDTGTPGLRRFSISLYNTADDASFYASGSWYQVAVDNIKIDGKLVRFWAGSFEIGRQSVHVKEITDTGIYDTLADYDSGTKDRLGKIGFDVDTGLRVHIDDSDTGVKDAIADLDSGLRDLITDAKNELDTGIKAHIDDLDTGLANLSVNLNQIRGDTGGADRFYRYTQKLDTGGDATVSASVDTGQVNQAVWQANAQRKVTVDTGIAFAVWQTATAGFNDDTGTFGELLRIPATATVDTGQVNQAVWQANASRTITSFDVDTGLRDFITDAKNELDTGIKAHIDDLDTGLTNLSVNVVQLVGDTGAASQLSQAFLTTPTYFQQVEVARVDADTGAANYLRATFADGFADTGVNDRLAKILADTDTGLKDEIATLDTGLRAILTTTGVVISDTGVHDDLHVIRGDVDTGIRAHINDLDTGLTNLAVNVVQLGGDTGALGWLKNTFASGFADTGLNNRLDTIGFDVDSGMRDRIADLDSGIRDYIDNTDTGLRARFNALAEDTGGVNINAIFGDTGAANQLRAAFANGFNDTGITNRFDRIQSEVDTGLRVHIDDSDTGIKDVIADLDTGLRAAITVATDTGTAANVTAIKAKTDSLTFTSAGFVDANVQKVNDVTVNGTGTSSDPWSP